MREHKEESLLEGYRVLDLTDDLGYLCGKILGGLGADVIKVEKPSGSPGRNRGPFYKDIVDPEKSLYWMFCNTSKRGITLNIETEDGRDILKRLVENADFLVESFKPGYLDALGLGFSVINEINPGIIMTSISPFGQTGPHAHFEITDMVIWAMGGMMYLAGESDRAPVRIGVPQAYFFGGLHAAVGSMVAHYYRETTGEGQHVDVSAQEGCILALANATEVWYLLHKNMMRAGDNQMYGRPEPLEPLKARLIWPCKDGYVCLALLGGGHEGVARSSIQMTQWALSEGMAQELRDFDWNKVDASKITQDEIGHYQEAIGDFIKTKTKKELFEKALETSMFLVPLNEPKDLLDSPQLVARDFWQKVEHPELDDSVIYPGPPVKIPEAPWRIRRSAPLIGEHNHEIYIDELGITTDELASLKHNGVI